MENHLCPPYSPNPNLVRSAHGSLASLARQHGSTWSPTEEALSEALRQVFWASLHHDEGRPMLPRLTLTEDENFPIEERGEAVRFDQATPASPRVLARMMAALPDSWDLLWSASSKSVFGASRVSSQRARIVAAAPGVVSVLWWIDTMAVFDQDHVFRPLHRKKIVERLTGFFPATVTEPALSLRTSALLQLARILRQKRHGGTILLVPPGEEWKQCLAVPAEYALRAPMGVLRMACVGYPGSPSGGVIGYEADYAFVVQGHSTREHHAFQQALRTVAAFAGADGAIVLGDTLSLLAFGAKITAPEVDEPVQYMEAETTATPVPRPIPKLGGTRHQSAARFTVAVPGAAALIISQDRHTTLMTNFPPTGPSVLKGIEHVD